MKSHAIKHLDIQSVHRISSGQVVIDLQTAVKELLENSLDAGSTNIGKLFQYIDFSLIVLRCSCATYVEVRFKEYGLIAVEVIDNGSGIAPEDYEAVGMLLH